MALHPLIQPHLEDIRALARRYGVAQLEVFGSATTTAFDPARSDVDFLVTYPDDYDFGPWLARFQDLEDELARLLGREVDLVMVSALRNRWFNREASQTRLVICDASENANATDDVVAEVTHGPPVRKTWPAVGEQLPGTVSGWRMVFPEPQRLTAEPLHQGPAP